jgi:hypothetical protein
MTHDLNHTMALLERTPAALELLLRGLPKFWTDRNEGGSTWTAVDVVGHLIHAERTDWMPRVRVILSAGESRPFEPFDREGYRAQGHDGSLERRLEEFAQARSVGLAELRALKLKPEDLERRGRHPTLGAVTLSQLLATWAGHDLSHLHQISRVLAYQIRDAVGPWSRNLGVLQCAGHSASP